MRLATWTDRSLVLAIMCAASLGAIACSGSSTTTTPPPDGPAAMGIIGGRDQVVHAERDVRLPEQVVAQIYRQANGAVSMRLLDVLLPARAYAQTAVNGIPGAVVCAVAPDPKHALTPEVPCTNTDLTGKAYFTYHADTVAGVSKSQVRGTVNGVTQVSDSVVATVLPGVATTFLVTPTGFLSAVKAGVRFNLRDSLLNVGDQFGNFPLPRASYRIAYRRYNTTCTSIDANGNCSAYSHALTDSTRIVADTITLRPGDTSMEIGVDSTWKGPMHVQFVP